MYLINANDVFPKLNSTPLGLLFITLLPPVSPVAIHIESRWDFLII